MYYSMARAWLISPMTHKSGYRGTLEHFDAHEMMAARLRSSAKPGDRILLKGSRGMRMENVWKALQA